MIKCEHNIYISSRTRHASIWKRLRDNGVNIISTWIDDVGKENIDYNNLWFMCSREIRRYADAVIVYCEESDGMLRGTFIELGIALDNGKYIVLVGPDEIYGSIAHTNLVNRAKTISEALTMVNEYYEIE